MATQKSPLLGYNHNLKYKGRVYHVQTEDSGLDNPHIFTHLFHDGTILNTQKQEYTDLAGNPKWESLLRTRMQGQHKDMMKGLIRGEFDDRIVQFFGTLEAEVAEEMPTPTLPPPPKIDRRAPEPPPAPPWDPSAAAKVPTSPPAARDAGVVVAMPMVIVGAGGQQTTAQPASPPQAVAPTATDQGPTFEPEKSKTVPDSIFGAELISEKSLDEVILAYLSEDMKDE